MAQLRADLILFSLGQLGASYMGLATVELLIRLEDSFGVRIPDDVAETLTTPRLVTFYLLSQLTLGESSTCMSQQAFYRLRREFVPALGIQRSDFHPAVNLSQLIPLESRSEVWTIVGSRIGVGAFPDLARPVWLFSLLSFATIATALSVFYYTRALTGSYVDAILFAVLAAIPALHFAEVLTRPLKRHFRYQYQHAGELAEYVALHSPHSFKKVWTKEEVASMVRQIIIEETGVTDFTEDSRFIEDMHLD